MTNNTSATASDADRQAVLDVLKGVCEAWEANDAEAFVADYRLAPRGAGRIELRFFASGFGRNALSSWQSPDRLSKRCWMSAK